jgi:hypothetical protein
MKSVATMKTSGGKKTKKRTSKRHNKKTRFLRPRISIPIPFIRGGSSVVFPASFSAANIASSPQSYLPYNNFANDPNYSVVSSSNTGPFLTSGGAKHKRTKTAKRRGVRFFRGGSDGATVLSNTMNVVTAGKGIMPVPHINESSGVSNTMSLFSNTGSLYNSANPSPMMAAPLA